MRKQGTVPYTASCNVCSVQCWHSTRPSSCQYLWHEKHLCFTSSSSRRPLKLQSSLQDVLSRLSQEASIVPGLMQLLSPKQSAGKEAAVSALALLTGHTPEMAEQCSLHPEWQQWLLCLLKHDQPATRLAACVCLQNICSVQAASWDSTSTEVGRSSCYKTSSLRHVAQS